MKQKPLEKIALVTLLVSIILFVCAIFAVPPISYIQANIINVAGVSFLLILASGFILLFIENNKRVQKQYQRDILGKRKLIVKRTNPTIETALGYYLYINNEFEGTISHSEEFKVESYFGVHQLQIKSRTGISKVIELDIRENIDRRIFIDYKPCKDINDADFDVNKNECYHITVE